VQGEGRTLAGVRLLTASWWFRVGFGGLAGHL